jgi:Zn-dependent protease with chaperone function
MDPGLRRDDDFSLPILHSPFPIHGPSMNFFEQQAAARRNSTRMLVLFVMAVIGIVIAVDLGVLLLLAMDSEQTGPTAPVLVFSSLVTLAVIGFGSLYRMASLRGGGEAVALQMGGTPVPENTTDFYLRRLRNVVEEIAIASGVPMPKLYVLQDEPGINAFAAGYAPADAAITVTRGALNRLNRDELQGVIAHEFSHILNGDMRLSIRLMGVLFGIMMLSIIGQRVLIYGRGGRGRNGNAVLILALVAMAAGAVGLFFGRLIKAGISRQRESLADASAVQFTRQTTGLAGALKKIAGLQEGSSLGDKTKAEEVSHMLFGDGFETSKWFATHPPLIERIRALEPSFNDARLQQLSRQWLAAPPNGLQEDTALGLTGSSASRTAAPPPLPALDASFALAPAGVTAQIATPDSDDYRHAGNIAAAVPEALRELATQRDSAMPLLLGLLLDNDETLAARQCSQIDARMGGAVADHAQRIHEQLTADLHPMLRLPLATLAFPSLRLRPRPELDTFISTVYAVVNADGEVSLFEYCLGRLLESQLRQALDPARYTRFGRRRLNSAKAELSLLLYVVAQAGSDDANAARRAYLAGMQHALPQELATYAPPAQGVRALDGVWDMLDALDPLAKQMAIEAIVATIGNDNRITVAEAELLRTLCGVLHCPLPAMLGDS